MKRHRVKFYWSETWHDVKDIPLSFNCLWNKTVTVALNLNCIWKILPKRRFSTNNLHRLAIAFINLWWVSFNTKEIYKYKWSKCILYCILVLEIVYRRFWVSTYSRFRLSPFIYQKEPAFDKAHTRHINKNHFRIHDNSIKHDKTAAIETKKKSNSASIIPVWLL